MTVLQTVKNWFKNSPSSNPQEFLEVEELREFSYFEPGQDEVFNLGLSEKEMTQDLEDRRQVIHRLKIQIRNHWKRYKQYLEQVSGEIGAERVEAESLAKNEKAAAKDKERLFKLVIKEYLILGDALRKHYRRKFWENQKQLGFRFDFGEVDVPEFRSDMEDIAEIQQLEIHQREEFAQELKLTEEDVELDFSDIEKDVEELELQDFEIEWDNEAEEDIGVRMSEGNWSTSPEDSEPAPDIDRLDF